MNLVHGLKYAAELDLPFYATKNMAKSRLEAAGFTGVQVWDADGKTWATGTWAVASTEADLPDHVVRAWPVQ